jgi:hypothetical protein
MLQLSVEGACSEPILTAEEEVTICAVYRAHASGCLWGAMCWYARGIEWTDVVNLELMHLVCPAVVAVGSPFGGWTC